MNIKEFFVRRKKKAQENYEVELLLKISRPFLQDMNQKELDNYGEQLYGPIIELFSWYCYMVMIASVNAPKILGESIACLRKKLLEAAEELKDSIEKKENDRMYFN